MKNVYLLMPLLCATPVLQSCTTVGGSAAAYGMKSMLETRNSSDSPEMHHQVGLYAQRQGRLDAAAAAYEQALELKSDYPEASNALATVYALQGRHDLAAERLRTAVKQSPRAAYLHNNLGYLLYLQGKYAEAIPSLEAAVALDPSYARAHSNLALAYGKSGNVQLAGEHHAQAVRLVRAVGAAHASATASARPRDPSVTRTAANAAPAAAQAKTSSNAPAGGTGSPGVPDTRPATGLIRIAPNIYELRSPAGPARRPPESVPAVQQAKQPALPDLRPFPLEVSNGNGITGMARRVAESLRKAGMKPVRLTNQTPYDQHLTEIQYGKGYAREAAHLAALLDQKAMMVRTEDLRADIKVRLVLGQDIKDEAALLRAPAGAPSTRVASSNEYR